MSSQNTPQIQTRVTITAVNILGSSVAMVFNAVNQLEFNYFKGMIRIVDQEQGEFFFGLTLVTTITTAVAGRVITVTIS